MKKKLAITFMAVGVVLIAFSMSLLIYNNYENKHAQKNTEIIVESLRQNIAENELKEKEDDPFDTEMKVKEIDGYGYIGYLTIPAIDLDLPVMSEWDYSRLKISPCRYFGSTKTDNLVIAAHNYESHFGSLDNLTPGDTVIFTDMEAKKLRYKVKSVELLLPTEVEKVKNTGDDLILYTCTYSRVKRITVRCSYAK